jgi:hypothetical protein
MRTPLFIAIILLAIFPLRAVADDARIPVPDTQQEARLRQAVQQQFSDLYASDDRKDRLELAKLLNQSAQEADMAGQQFVALSEARDAFARAGDLINAERICGLLANKFTVSISTARLQMFKAAADAQTDREVYFSMLTKAVDVALIDDDFAPAAELIETGKNAAETMHFVPWDAASQIRQKRLDAQLKAFPLVKPALAALQKDPADPQSNVILGEYTCFIKNDWRSGLTMLARGDDLPLKQLAQMDLQDPEDTDPQIAIADGWLAMAAHLPNFALAVECRAYDWNVRALPFATMPPQRSHVQEQIKALIPLVKGERETPEMWLMVGDDLSHRIGVPSRVAGGNKADQAFRNMPKLGGLLTGFRVGYAMLGKQKVITYLQPIYSSPTGEQLGRECGRQYSAIETFRAPPGFAIGAMRSCGGDGLNSITITYMRIVGDHLDRDDVITTPRIGGPGGTLEIQTGQGIPVVGVVCKHRDGYVGIGLIYSHAVKDN